MLLCKCGNNGSKYCINKHCKKCCNNTDCEIHFKNLCIVCNKKKNIKCDYGKCYDCCENINCTCISHKKKFRICIECNDEIYGSNCIEIKCVQCCKNKYCKEHNQNWNKCIKCENKRYKCIYKYCYECCDNMNCTKHNVLCNCGINNRDKFCKNCLCKECCTNLKCSIHYLQDENLSIKILNNYKIELLKMNILPIDIINIIVNEFVDARYKCCICYIKITYEKEECFGNPSKCTNCDLWCCHWSKGCSKYELIYGIPEHYCNDCHGSIDFNETDSFVSNDSEDTDYHF